MKPGGELITSLERTTTTLQKQALAEKVQRDKHERLRRSLECSGAEGLRLLSVRQRGALGRLVVRRRAAKHDRETDLRGSLARVKGGVARLWREHNRRRSRYCGGSGGSGGPRSSGGADAPAAGGGNGLRGAGGGGDRSRPKPSGGPPGGGGGGGGVVDRREDARDTTAVPASAGEVGSSIDRGGEEGEEADGGDAREWRGSGTSSADDENLSASGRRRPGDDRMNPDGTIARASGGTTTAGRGNFEGGTAAATPPAPTSEVNDDKIEETRTASSPGPSSTSSSRRRKAGSKRGGTPWERKNRAVATPGVAAAAAATGTAATAGTEDGAACDGSFGVLSEGELRALAALGRGAPDDPRLLLSTFPLPPPRRRQRPLPSTRARADELEEKEERASESRSGNNGLGTVLLDDGVDGCRAGGGFESAGEDQRTAVEGGACASNAYDEVLLDRAMDKLARKIRADEEMSRRELGMAPLSMSM